MPLNVLYLHHVARIGGAENSLYLLLRALDRARVRPLFAGPVDGPFPAALTGEGIPVFSVPFGPLKNVPQVIRSVMRLRRIIREQKVQLLHSNGPQTNVCAGLAGWLEGIPAVWHVRNLLYGSMRDIDRLCAGLATRIVCNSEAIRERFRGSSAWDKSVTILNAVDLGAFNPQASDESFRRQLGVPSDRVVVGMVGRIGLGKGHVHFIDAAIRLLRGGANVQFVIVGDAQIPEESARLEMLCRRVKDAQAEDRIRFLGFRQDMPQVMRGLDILVLASDAEPCGRVLFEAMASGRAIVATNSGGTPEIVRDGSEGLLVPPRDPDALAAAIRKVIEEPALRQRLGHAGAVRARQEFSVERHVTRILDVYEAAGSRHR
jgi:glycosyltransferase involved in cell wall biosynthesis